MDGEVAQDFGTERPIRSFELLADIQASWNKDKMINLFVLKNTPLALPLSRNVSTQRVLYRERSFPTGAVKYHPDASYVRIQDSGKKASLSLIANPSHLEAVNHRAKWQKYVVIDISRYHRHGCNEMDLAIKKQPTPLAQYSEFLTGCGTFVQRAQD